jgi:hypothetical protein
LVDDTIGVLDDAMNHENHRLLNDLSTPFAPAERVLPVMSARCRLRSIADRDQGSNAREGIFLFQSVDRPLSFPATIFFLSGAIGMPAGGPMCRTVAGQFSLAARTSSPGRSRLAMARLWRKRHGAAMMARGGSDSRHT